MEASSNVMLVEYCCHDESFEQSLEGEQRKATWKIEVCRLRNPILIELQTSDKDAGVRINGVKVLPKEGTDKRCTLESDFEHLFRPIPAGPRGLHEPECFEFHPGLSCSGDAWYPATLTGQLADGTFNVVAVMPYDGKQRQLVEYPGVNSTQLRVKSTGQPPEQLQYCIEFIVPVEDPCQARLLLNGEPITNAFVRPTPAHCRPGVPEAALPRVKLQVDSDRSNVTADVNHAFFEHFLSCEPRRISTEGGLPYEGGRMSKKWRLEIGPDIEHTILLEKRFISTDIISLSVDGTYFVEASASDLGSANGQWICNFSFVGERLLEFEVYEENWMHEVMDTKSVVIQRRHVCVNCRVTLESDHDFHAANLIVNDHDFMDLRHCDAMDLRRSRGRLSETNISAHPETLTMQYEIKVPYRLNEAGGKGILSWASDTLLAWGLDVNRLSELSGLCQRPCAQLASMAAAAGFDGQDQELFFLRRQRSGGSSKDVASDDNDKGALKLPDRDSIVKDISHSGTPMSAGPALSEY
jgi:hypothetical protein